MKLILAGMPKTGTKSLNVALTQLGFKVYDIMEHFLFAGDEWIALMKDTATSEPLREIYKDVDAVCDSPACYFWDEMLKLFPEAKVILMVRDDEHQWERSFQKQLNSDSNYWNSFVSYMGYRFYKFFSTLSTAMFSLPGFKPWSRVNLSPARAKSTYLRHNAYVMQAAPKHKLLVYNVKEGWAPLCKFLDVEEPKIPFPHQNQKADFFQEMNEHPVFVQMRREAYLSFGMLAALFAIVFYWKFPHILSLSKYLYEGIFELFPINKK